jgi:hypothetical protein
LLIFLVIHSGVGTASQSTAEIFSGLYETYLPLTISSPYKQIFRNFESYFYNEMQAIRDETLGQELTILDKLSR